MESANVLIINPKSRVLKQFLSLLFEYAFFLMDQAPIIGYNRAMEMTGQKRSALLKAAHSLKPVVMVGKLGPTDGVFQAVDQALGAHELIKVKFQGFKEERRRISAELAERSGAVLVRLLGNVAILYRPDPEKRAIDV
jgi:RNA-binding protein